MPENFEKYKPARKAKVIGEIKFNDLVMLWK